MSRGASLLMFSYKQVGLPANVLIWAGSLLCSCLHVSRLVLILVCGWYNHIVFCHKMSSPALLLCYSFYLGLMNLPYIVSFITCAHWSIQLNLVGAYIPIIYFRLSYCYQNWCVTHIGSLLQFLFLASGGQSLLAHTERQC